jgi:phosphoserine phosphatase RsbU/P
MTDKASLQRLKLSNFKLDSLLNITLSINENLPTHELLDRYKNILRDDLSIGRVIIFWYISKWTCLLSSGFNDECYKDLDVEKDLLKYTEITSLTSSKPSILSPFDVVIPVYHKNIPLAYLLIGDIDDERNGVSPTIKHLHFIQTLTNIIIVAIENKRLYRENLKQESLKKELELASKMQNMLIPAVETLPKNDKIYVSAFYHPHSDVGGDYYDIIQLNDNEFGFCIADVSGKGISAALIMSNFQAGLRALFTSEISLSSLISKLNKTVMTNTNGEKFITMFIGIYNTFSRELYYINAGHNPPILYDQASNSIKYLKEGCVGLGMFSEIPVISEGIENIHAHSKLICYTDGLVECENENKEEFGTDEIEKNIASDQKMEVIIANTMNNLNNFKGKRPYIDDITIIGLEFY